jgi:hypothetical protein
MLEPKEKELAKRTNDEIRDEGVTSPKRNGFLGRRDGAVRRFELNPKRVKRGKDNEVRSTGNKA